MAFHCLRVLNEHVFDQVMRTGGVPSQAADAQRLVVIRDNGGISPFIGHDNHPCVPQQAVGIHLALGHLERVRLRRRAVGIVPDIGGHRIGPGLQLFILIIFINHVSRRIPQFQADLGKIGVILHRTVSRSVF